MKVILLQDIQHLGKKMDVKEVSDGHAINFLIPKKLVKTATAAALKQLDLDKAKIAAERKIQEDLLVKNLKNLEQANIEAKEKANDKGHLFAGIHKNELVKLIKDQTHLDILPDFIDLDEPIKQLGDFKIGVTVQDKKAVFNLKVTAA